MISTISPSTGYFGFRYTDIPVDISTCNRLSLPILPRFFDRFAGASGNIRIVPFHSRETGTLACIAASVWWHHTAAVYRDAEYAEVLLTAQLLTQEFLFQPPDSSLVVKAVKDPELFWRRISPVSQKLAHAIFQAMYPQPRCVGDIFAADYTHLGWRVVEDGQLVELLLLMIVDLYSRFIVTWGTFTRRPHAADFRTYLEALAVAGLLPNAMRLDNEVCFTARGIREYLAYHSIELQRTPPGKPQFNGAIEARNRRTKSKLPPDAPHLERGPCEAFLEKIFNDYHSTENSATRCSPGHLAGRFISQPIIIHG